MHVRILATKLLAFFETMYVFKMKYHLAIKMDTHIKTILE
jgi:hypothetical protein